MKSARMFAGSVLGLMLMTAPAFAATSVNVPLECTVVDTDGVSHTYAGQYLGVCALFAAREQSAVSAYTLQNFSFGLFLQSLNGITPGATEYWALYKNGTEAAVGLTDMLVVQGDTLLFRLTDFTTNDQLGSPVEFSIGSLVGPTAAVPPPSEGIRNIASDFDVTKAVLFLKSFQNADGALPEPLLSDWAAFAFASHDIGDARAKLREYFLRWKPELSKATDYERHAMALLALGIDPYIGTGTDYITPIVEAFDGMQVGDPSFINDDIFALFPLLHAGYRSEDEMPQRIRDGIIAAQRPDGSWEGSIDLTAAAIQALSLFKRAEATQRALSRADGYLSSQQADNGGFGNSFSTAWAMQAVSAIGDSHTVWTRQIYHTPRYYFSALQQKDGGVETPTVDSFTRLWVTAYAVPAVTGRTWDSLMGHFQKPAGTIPDEVSVVAATTTPAQEAILIPATPEFAAAAIPPSAWDTAALDVPNETSSDPATSTSESQTATVADAVDANGTWMWMLGLIAVLGGAFYSLRFGR